MVTADRGFAAVARVEVRTALGVEFSIRVKGSPKVCWRGQGRHLPTLRFAGTTRQRNLGQRA